MQQKCCALSMSGVTPQGKHWLVLSDALKKASIRFGLSTKEHSVSSAGMAMYVL